MIAAVSFSGPACRFVPNEDDYTAAIVDAARCISEGAGAKLAEYPDYEVEVHGT